MLQAVIAASECAQLFESVWKCVLKEIRLACSPGFGRNSPHRRSGSGVSTFVPLFQGGRRVFCGRGFFISSEHTPCSPLAKGDKPLAKGQSLKIGVFATSRRFDCAVSSDYGYLATSLSKPGASLLVPLEMTTKRRIAGPRELPLRVRPHEAALDGRDASRPRKAATRRRTPKCPISSLWPKAGTPLFASA